LGEYLHRMPTHTCTKSSLAHTYVGTTDESHDFVFALTYVHMCICTYVDFENIISRIKFHLGGKMKAVDKGQRSFHKTVFISKKFELMEYSFEFFFRANDQGCQMVYFQTKNTNLGKFWRFLKWKMFIYSVVIWNILLPRGSFMAIW
jgi:hypothetical protein